MRSSSKKLESSPSKTTSKTKTPSKSPAEKPKVASSSLSKQLEEIYDSVSLEEEKFIKLAILYHKYLNQSEKYENENIAIYENILLGLSKYLPPFYDFLTRALQDSNTLDDELRAKLESHLGILDIYKSTSNTAGRGR